MADVSPREAARILREKEERKQREPLVGSILALYVSLIEKVACAIEGVEDLARLPKDEIEWHGENPSVVPLDLDTLRALEGKLKALIQRADKHIALIEGTMVVDPAAPADNPPPDDGGEPDGAETVYTTTDEPDPSKGDKVKPDKPSKAERTRRWFHRMASGEPAEPMTAPKEEGEAEQ